MDRQSNLDILYTSPPMDRDLTTFEFIQNPCCILQLLTIQDIYQLNSIAKSKKLASQPTVKLKKIKDIMEARGFKRLSGGTNRIAYKYMEDQRFIIKVAYDHVGLSDNINEFYNQNILKPFCTKVFEVSPCGTVGLFERVTPIMNREQFYQVSSSIFDIIVNKFLGKYILADFGTKFFMNWGIRKNAHPVILDFPYVYELDGAKLYCNKPELNEYGFCGGEIDYDDGFNYLRCTKCGKTFLASELKKALETDNGDIIISEEDSDMIVNVYRGDELIQSVDTTRESQTYKRDKKGRRKETPLEYRTRKRYNDLQVEVVRQVIEEDDDTQNDTIDNSNYVERIVPKKNNDTPKPRLSEYNNRVSLDHIATNVEDMYRDMSIKCITRDGSEYTNGVKVSHDNDTKSTPEARHVEETLNLVDRAVHYNTYSSSDVVEEKNESTTVEENIGETSDSSDTVEEVPEEQQTDEENSNVNEEPSTEEDSSESNGSESPGYQDDDEFNVEVSIEPRGEDRIKKRFENQSADSEFFD